MSNTYITTLHTALKARGVEVHERGLLTFTVGGQSAMLLPVGDLPLPEAQQRVAGALVALAEYAQAGDAVMRDPRLTGLAKDQDMRKLTTEIAARLQRDLEGVGAALVDAEAEVDRDFAPVPVPPAPDAVTAVGDTELRGLLRAMQVPDAMEACQREYAYLLAAMRLPAGLDPALTDFCREVWRQRNPQAEMATEAARKAAAWREARRIVGEAVAATVMLSGGRVSAMAA